eukprot:9375027-Pyramimonas_sp.AAC.1
MSALRTWGNGWLTSYRTLHPQGQLKCRFGCQRPDRLQHYARCPILYNAVCRGMQRPMPRPLAERRCLTLPRPDHLENMYVMYQTHNLTRQGTLVSTPGQLRGYVSAAIRPLRLARPSDRLRRWEPPPAVQALRHLQPQ